jgi:hypothetical protein
LVKFETSSHYAPRVAREMAERICVTDQALVFVEFLIQFPRAIATNKSQSKGRKLAHDPSVSILNESSCFSVCGTMTLPTFESKTKT